MDGSEKKNVIFGFCSKSNWESIHPHTFSDISVQYLYRYWLTDYFSVFMKSTWESIKMGKTEKLVMYGFDTGSDKKHLFGFCLKSTVFRFSILVFAFYRS